MEGPPTPGPDRYQPRVDEIAVRREEARVAGLEDNHLAAVRVEDGDVVCADDPVPEDPVAECPVRHAERHRVAEANRFDVGERGQVGRPVARDVDELPLAWHVGAQVATRAFPERRVVGPVDEDHVQAEARHVDPADRLAPVRGEPVAMGLALDRAHLGTHRLRPGDETRLVRGEALAIAVGELVLLPVRVKRREGVLPAPDDDDPDQHQQSRHDQAGACDPNAAP